MPGYTKAQLEEKGSKLLHFAWCPGCRLWWHKAGLKKHKAAGHRRVHVKMVVGPLTKEPTEPVVVLENPKGFIAYLVERAVEAWERGERPRMTQEALPGASAEASHGAVGDINTTDGPLEEQHATLIKRRARLDERIAEIESRLTGRSARAKRP